MGKIGPFQQPGDPGCKEVWAPMMLMRMYPLNVGKLLQVSCVMFTSAHLINTYENNVIFFCTIAIKSLRAKSVDSRFGLYLQRCTKVSSCSQFLQILLPSEIFFVIFISVCQIPAVKQPLRKGRIGGKGLSYIGQNSDEQRISDESIF